MKILAPLRDEIDRRQTGDLTGWSSLVPGKRRQHLAWGLQGLWPFLIGWWWVNKAVLQESWVQSEATILHLGGSSKTLLCIFPWVGTRTLSGGCTNLRLFLLFLYPLPSLISIVWIHPLELREGQGGWMKPISYRQEMENTELISTPEPYWVLLSFNLGN